MQESKAVLSMRCAHCGRAVRPTVHYRDGYTVDYHFTYTGTVEEDETWDEREGVSRVFVRVRNLHFVFTCIQCAAHEDVQRQRAAWFGGEAGDQP